MMDNRFLSERADERVLYLAMIHEETGVRIDATYSVAVRGFSSAVRACRIVGFCTQVPVIAEQGRPVAWLIPLEYSADKALLPAEWPVPISTVWWY